MNKQNHSTALDPAQVLASRNNFKTQDPALGTKRIDYHQLKRTRNALGFCQQSNEIRYKDGSTTCLAMLNPKTPHKSIGSFAWSLLPGWIDDSSSWVWRIDGLCMRACLHFYCYAHRLVLQS